MADVTTPASLSYSGGTLRCNRLVPARLRYQAQTITSTKDSPLSTAAETPKLDRLQRLDRIVKDGVVDQRFQLIWQQSMEAIESAFVAVNARVDEVAILARVSAVERLAEAANDNATAAQATASQTTAAISQTFSEIDPVYKEYFDEVIEP